jgi:hypothetical protein|tara:strand:- start:165 stop:614 length:450 start_codon:yes stop_codon:yes gene_type:complete
MIRIADWNSGKFLTFSSGFFLLPASYGWYIYSLTLAPFILTTASIISMNYWRDALDNWRRQLDLYYAKFTLSYCVYNGIVNCPTTYTLFIGFPSLYGMLHCFNKSHEMYEYREDTKIWIVYHMGFHTLVTTQLFAMMYYMGKNNLEKIK